jgi:hypothetical protein
MQSFKILMDSFGNSEITKLFKKDVSELPQLAGKRIDWLEFSNYEEMEQRIGRYDFYIMAVSIHSNSSVPDQFPWAKITNPLWGWIPKDRLIVVADSDSRNETYIRWAVESSLANHHFTQTNYPEFLEKFITMISKI